MTINLNNYEDWFAKRLSSAFQNKVFQEVDSPELPPSPNPEPVDPSVTNPPDANPSMNAPPQNQENPPDFASDPTAPDMLDNEDGNDPDKDFETWKKEFFELSIAGDTNEMIDFINLVRARKLSASQRRFVEDNIQILLIRQDANIDKASKEIRKLISQKLDRNNPGVSISQHIYTVLADYPFIKSMFLKMAGQGVYKGHLHRQLIAALLGAVQVGSGGDKEDLIYAAKDYSINISTRFYTKFGDITIGHWSLDQDDPDKYLSDSERSRLSEGSPEEKVVLRHRICLESISSRYRNQTFLINIVEPDTGINHYIGWDIAESLKSGYKAGKIVVRKRSNDVRNAMIDDNGNIVTIFGYDILYRRSTDDLDSSGNNIMKNMLFLEQKDGTLYLKATDELIEQFAGSMPGMFYRGVPYDGNPSDIINLMHCFPSTIEMLMRRC